MRKIIKGLLYDTDTAECLYSWNNGYYGTDFKYRSKALFRTTKGNLFLYHSGGAMTDMRQTAGSNSWSGGEDIEPIDEKTAVKFLETHDGADVIMSEFPDHYDEA